MSWMRRLLNALRQGGAARRIDRELAGTPFSWLLVRTNGDPGTAVAAIRRTVNEVDPLREVYEVAPLEEWIGDSSRRTGCGRSCRRSSPSRLCRWPASAATRHSERQYDHIFWYRRP